MRSKSIFVFFVVVFLVSCASPAPQPTVTVVPSSTHTALPTSTETPEPTPTVTATPDPLAKLPEEMRRLIGDGTFQWDEEKQLAYERKTGLVQGYIGLDGKWYPTPGGNVAIPAGDGSGAPPLEVPIYASIQDALWDITDELPWNDRTAYQQGSNRKKQIEEHKEINAKYFRPIFYNGDWEFDFERYEVGVEATNNPADTATIMGVIELQLPGDNEVTLLVYASRATDYYYKYVVVQEDAVTTFESLASHPADIFVPGQGEVRGDN